MKGINEKVRAMRNVYSMRYRIEYPGAIFHLIQRAPGNEKLFIQEEDYLHMLKLIKEAVNEFSWKVFSFVLMPNHLHLLIQILKENLSEGAKFIFGNYAMGFNKKYGRKGPVFCKPFRAFICLNDAYLFTASIYIHLNPYKAGLVNNPLKYRWSSLNLYLGNKNFKTFLDYKFILSILNSDIKQAKQIYYNMLKDAADLEYKDLLEEKNFIRKFCLNIMKLKVFYSSIQYNKGKELTPLVAHKSSLSVSEKKKLIDELLTLGYQKSEIANFLNISRQHLYRLMRNVTHPSSSLV